MAAARSRDALRRPAPPHGDDPAPSGSSELWLLTEAGRGALWRRLYQTRFRDPLGYGCGPSRFSDPETGLVHPERFGVVYLGSSVKVCFVEAILRDRSAGRTQTFPMEWREPEAWTCAEIRVAAPLNLVDFRGDGLIRMGIPTDVARARSQDLGRAWSRAVWSHEAQPDGIIYDSRLNGETNVVVLDRALPKLVGHATPRLAVFRLGAPMAAGKVRSVRKFGWRRRGRSYYKICHTSHFRELCSLARCFSGPPAL